MASTGLNRKKVSVKQCVSLAQWQEMQAALDDKRKGGSRKRPRWEPPHKAATAKRSSPAENDRQSDKGSAGLAPISRPCTATTHGRLHGESAGAVGQLQTRKRWEPPAAAALPGRSMSKLKTEAASESPKARPERPDQNALAIKTETAESNKARSEQSDQSAVKVKTEDTATEPGDPTVATSSVPKSVTDIPRPDEANAEFKYSASARSATLRSCATFASQCRASAVSWKPDNLPTNASFLRSSKPVRQGQQLAEEYSAPAAAQPRQGALTEQTLEHTTVRTDFANAVESDKDKSAIGLGPNDAKVKVEPVLEDIRGVGQGQEHSKVTIEATCAPFAKQSRSPTGSWKSDDLLANASFSLRAGTNSQERQPTEEPVAAAANDYQPDKIFEQIVKKVTAGAGECAMTTPANNEGQDDDDKDEDGDDKHRPSICLAWNQPFMCLACNIDLKSKERYATHVEGKKHKRMMEACFCEVCLVSCKNEKNYMKHLRGKRHRKNCAEMHKKLRIGGEAKEAEKKKVRGGDGEKVADLSASAKNRLKVQEDLAGKDWRTKMEIANTESGAPLAVVKYMVARNTHTSQCKLAVCPDRLFRYRCVVAGCPKHIDVDTSGFEEHPRFYTEYLWARRRTKRGLGLLSVQVPLDYSSLNQVSRAAASAGMRSTGAQLTLIEGIRAESGRQSWTNSLVAQLGAFKSALLSNPVVEIVALKAHPTTTGYAAASAAPVAATNATLAIFGISSGTTAGHIRALFEPRCGGGRITRVELRSARGFGFLDFDSESAVTRIMQQHAARPISLFGRPLRVQKGTSHATPPRADASVVIVAEILLGRGGAACRNSLVAGKSSGCPVLAMPQRPLHVTLGVVPAEEAEAKIDQVSPALVGTKLRVFAHGLSVLAPSFEEKMIFERNIDHWAVTEFIRDGKEAAERLNRSLSTMSANCGSSPVPPLPISETTKTETKEDKSGARHNEEDDVNGDGGGENSGQGKYKCNLSALDDSAVLAEARRYISKVATLCARVDKELSNYGF